MTLPLSQKQIGSRLALIRKFKGLSQEELAKQIDIPRTSLTQIELGGRNLSALELWKIAVILSFSIDYFLSDDFEIDSVYEKRTSQSLEVSVERKPDPIIDLPKLKQVFLYVLEKVAGKPNIGELEIQKLLYLCDFNYYELYEEHLTGLKYEKLSTGPVGEELDHFIQKLLIDREIQRVKTKGQIDLKTRYLPLRKANLQYLKASEKEVIDYVIEQFSNWSSNSITSYCEKDLPMVATKVGKRINYELVFYRDIPYSVRNYEFETQEQ